MATGAVVSGLKPLLKDLKDAGELDARRDLMHAVKAGAEIILERAKENARANFTMRSGRLVGLLKISNTATAVSIRDTAKNPKDGYPYPSRFEYGGRGSGTVGRGAFVQPAVDSKMDEALRAIADNIDKALKHHDL